MTCAPGRARATACAVARPTMPPPTTATSTRGVVTPWSVGACETDVSTTTLGDSFATVLFWRPQAALLVDQRNPARRLHGAGPGHHPAGSATGRHRGDAPA